MILANMLNLLIRHLGEALVHVFQPDQYRALPVDVRVNYIATVET